MRWFVKLLIWAAASCAVWPSEGLAQFARSPEVSVAVKNAGRKRKPAKRSRKRARKPTWTQQAKIMMKKFGPCGSPEGVEDRFRLMPDGTCNWDIQRMPPDLFVVHHTEDVPGMSIRALSEFQKKRLYDKHFRQSSGHFLQIDGKRTEFFGAYQWMIRQTGQVVNLLREDQIGWNTGDWEHNIRAVAAVLDGDYDEPEATPNSKMLAALDSLVLDQMLKHPGMIVLPHHEIKDLVDPGATKCPGQWYYRWREGLEQRLWTLWLKHESGSAQGELLGQLYP